MALAGWLAVFAVGLLAGAVSGLVGIGGGAVMVPFLYFFLARTELAGVLIPSSDQAVVAHATSLLVIVPVSLRGALLYHREGLVDWRAVWRMGLASILGAVLGARVALAVPGELLKLVFGVFLITVGTRLAFGRKTEAPDRSAEEPNVRMGRALAGGGAVGFFSALLGVGGGLVAIPVLIYWLNLPIRKVSATSLAIITFTAATGVVAYALSGLAGDASELGAFNYFHFPAALGMAVGALSAVPLGTRAQLRMPTHALRKLFAVVFFILGARIAIGNLLTLLGR